MFRDIYLWLSPFFNNLANYFETIFFYKNIVSK